MRCDCVCEKYLFSCYLLQLTDTMDETHKSLLRKNRIFILNNIANPIAVSEVLYSFEIFTESMKQEVEAEKTQFDKVRKILDIVPMRGPQAFNKFYEALLATGNGTVADKLKTELAVEEIELPKTWPSKQDMEQPVEVRQCDVNSRLVAKQWQSNNVYSMKKHKRGRCVIISNQVFQGPKEKDKYGIPKVVLSDREGTEKDVLRLEQLFEQLHFEVIKHEGKKAQEIEELLKSEARHSDHRDAECFVLIVCSHGTTKGIYGVDGKIISHEEIFSIFNSKNCPNLISKPKLIFLQACHGEKTDVGGVSNQNTTDAEQFREGDEDNEVASGIQESLEHLQLQDGKGDHASNNTGQNTADAQRLKSVPSNTDFLIARATHPDYVSFRDTYYGTWFIQAVVWVFQRYACDEDLNTLLTLVNRLVAKGRTLLGKQEVMQAARFESSLEKKIYFFPGIAALDS